MYEILKYNAIYFLTYMHYPFLFPCCWPFAFMHSSVVAIIVKRWMKWMAAIIFFLVGFFATKFYLFRSKERCFFLLRRKKAHIIFNTFLICLRSWLFMISNWSVHIKSSVMREKKSVSVNFIITCVRIAKGLKSQLNEFLYVDFVIFSHVVLLSMS